MICIFSMEYLEYKQHSSAMQQEATQACTSVQIKWHGTTASECLVLATNKTKATSAMRGKND